jgi:DnaJ-class molecular chaperone
MDRFGYNRFCHTPSAKKSAVVCVNRASREDRRSTLEDCVRKNTGQKKQKCKNCEGKGTLKKGDKIVRCRRCGGTGIKP